MSTTLGFVKVNLPINRYSLNLPKVEKEMKHLDHEYELDRPLFNLTNHFFGAIENLGGIRGIFGIVVVICS